MSQVPTVVRRKKKKISSFSRLSIVLGGAVLYMGLYAIILSAQYRNGESQTLQSMYAPFRSTEVRRPHRQSEQGQVDENDPDGLQRRLRNHWGFSDCLFNDTLLPPIIHRLNGTPPLISPRLAKNDRPFVGVILDAARHYFPIEWLYGLVDFLAVLGYDWIHFRIVDDQSFVLKLDCHPELAVAVHPTRTNEIYTAAEMRAFVQYAKSKGISILPEVNVPGHAGGWQGIPGMLHPCTRFICGSGVALPMNVDNPIVLDVIENVLREVLDIFSTAPYLHLGGDELWMSEPCSNELLMAPNYTAFEIKLEHMLVHKLNYSVDKVIRWEQTGGGGGSSFDLENELDETVIELAKRAAAQVEVDKSSVMHRAGNIQHWWLRAPPSNKSSPGQRPKPFFISTDLYFDVSGDRNAFDIFRMAQARFGLVPNSLKPAAVLAGTFELGPCTWNIRNVWGKLIALAMASSERRPASINKPAFIAEYLEICRSLGLPQHICSLFGKPTMREYEWEQKHKLLQAAWIDTVCDRLTITGQVVDMQIKDYQDGDPILETVLASGRRALHFRNMVKEEKLNTESTVRKTQPLIKAPVYASHVYNYTGVMVDLTHGLFGFDTMRKIIDVISQLGFNLLHLRLVSNEAFALSLLEYRSFMSSPAFTADEIKLLVAYAEERGVQIMPEVNFLSNAGGWYKSGLLVACPRRICDVGGPIPVNLLKSRALFVLSTLFGHLSSLFNTSEFFHLGSFDQKAAEPCYREAYPMGKLDMKKTFRDFEANMQGLFGLMGIHNDRIIRYAQPIDDSSRVLGGVTHFYDAIPANRTVVSGPFFVSIDASLDDSGDSNAWAVYERTRASYNNGATGVLVGTDRMNRDNGDTRNVFGRLVAVAAGLASKSSLEPLQNEATFRSHYLKTCRRLGLSTNVCASFGKSAPSGTAWTEGRKSVKQNVQDQQCKNMTHATISRLPRSSVFGQ